MDISSRRATDTFDLELLDPSTGEPIRNEAGEVCSITMHGPASKAYKAAQSAASARVIDRLKRKGKTTANPEEDDTARAAFLSAITIRLNGFEYEGASDEKAIRALYLDAGLGWIAEQANAAAGDWSNFTQASPTS
jgi:hypothetical protein